MHLRITILLVLFLALNAVLHAQNHSGEHNVRVQVPEVALLSLASEGAADIGLQALSPVEAGDAVDFPATGNKSIWINYSSIVRDQIHSRKIAAAVQGEIPEGIYLTVEASNPLATGNGRLGQPAGTVRLSQQPADIIVGIGSCYTGKGFNNGHSLTYRVNYDEDQANYEALKNEQVSLNVIYTLTDTN